MELVVSCSLDGRDLAVVKSLININNIFGRLSLAYVDDAKASQILITKDYFDTGSVYYALNRKSGKKFPIEPGINPQTVRNLFETLAKDLEIRDLNTEPEDLLSIHQFILQQAYNDSEEKLLIKHPELTLVIDDQLHLVYSTQNLSDEVICQFGQNPISSIEFSFINSTISDNYCQKMNLELFKWKLGLCLKDKLYDESIQNGQHAFKLISWPNFGELPFQNEFIRLSSMLWKRSETFEELIQHSGYGQEIVYPFLNATLMSGNVIVSTNTIETLNKAVKKESHFLNSLKKLFTFN